MRTQAVEVKPWYTSKMLWVNMAAMVAGVGTWMTTGDTEALVVSGMGVLNFVLRLVTKAPLE